MRADIKTLLLAIAAAAVIMLQGCSVTPTTVTKTEAATPTANLPMPGPTAGAIYSVAAYRPIFEGRRASRVGDILTINFVENVSATTAGTGNLDKKGTGTSTFTNAAGNTVEPTYNMSNEAKNEITNSGSNSNSFTGSMTASVIEVRQNGNLVVSGEKQVALDACVEFVRFSGVVNPYMITNDNAVASNTIADARIEYRTNSTFDLANIVKKFNRMFQSLVPG